MSERLQHALRFADKLAEAPLSNIYFVQSLHLTKIGYAAYLPDRLSDYKVHNPHGVKLLATFKTREPKRDEDLLHTLFSTYHTQGEWFELPKPVLKLLSKGVKSAQALVDTVVALAASN